MNNHQRADFEEWYQQHHGDRAMYGRDASGEYTDKLVQGAYNAWQAALESPEVRELRDALWVATEHNALHFGESHNTVIQGRAALITMEKQK